MKEIVKLEACNIEQLANLSGVRDEHLEVIEDSLQIEIEEEPDNFNVTISEEE